MKNRTSETDNLQVSRTYQATGNCNKPLLGGERRRADTLLSADQTKIVRAQNKIQSFWNYSLTSINLRKMKELQNYVMNYLNENCVHYDEHLAHVVSRIGLEFTGQEQGWQKIPNVQIPNASDSSEHFRHPLDDLNRTSVK